MNFSPETKMKDIALSNPAARQVLEDAGLDYCCGGGKSLHESCIQADVPAEEILDRLRVRGQSNGPDDLSWMAMPLWELTQHIRDKHHRYVRESIRGTQTLLDLVTARHGKAHPEVAEIGKIFTEVGREMIMHMQKEEQILFPYIEALERATDARGSVEPPFFQTVRNPIHAMMQGIV